jgi:4-hydroxy-tetrahydrodipicolinate reductase
MSKQKVKVAIAGINGRMGKAAYGVFAQDEQLALTGVFGRSGAAYVGSDVAKLTGHSSSYQLKVASGLKQLLDDAALKPDVLFDVTLAESAMEHARIALSQGVRTVIGSSGLTTEMLDELASLASQHKVGAFVVPNFSLGAVLMVEFARQAAKYFDNSEIVELHHTKKLDAPSGTASYTLQKMAQDGKQFNQSMVQERELMPGARGALHQSGLRVHSLRLPGLISHQEVFFGGEGELLTIKHDSFNTSCFNKGMQLAVKSAVDLKELKIGLESVL